MMEEFRTKPNDVHEMMRWGMIGHFVYKKVKDLPSKEAMELVYSTYGTQTWSFGFDHFDEYIKTNNIDVKSMTQNEFAVFIIKATKGRVNPAVVHEYYVLKIKEQ